MRKSKLSGLALVSLFLVSLAHSGTKSKPAPARQSVGIFSNVLVGDETGDCGGYKVWLWKENDKVVGQLAFFEGGCKEYPKPLFDVKYDEKTGELSFKVITDQERYVTKFHGELGADVIMGEMSMEDKLGETPSPYNQDEVELKKVKS